MKRVTQLAHDLISERLLLGQTAVDATAGNGYDTLFLARLVGKNGQVHAFDIQEAALASTRSRLAEGSCETPVHYHHCSHVHLGEKVNSASAITFNLGYLPGADHGIITQRSSTLTALEASLQILISGGILICICYPGHPGGLEEAEAVLTWAKNQPTFKLITANEKDRHQGRPFLVALMKSEMNET